MKVALIQIDGKIPNLALMKLASWHRKLGDDVTVIDLSNFEFDRIYGSKIFMGGSGYDLKSQLPPEIEAQVPDYELFKTNYSIGFTSRGCIRDCGFCIVKEKEGMLYETPFDWIIHDKVLLFDNNFLASPQWKEKLQYFIRHKIKVCFTQGLDIRLVNDENAFLLAQTRYYDRHFRKRALYFAFDDPKLEPIIIEKVKLLNDNGIPNKHLRIYMLVGFDTTFEQDMHRYEVLTQLGVMPFIMLYNNTRDKQLRRFARWVNKRYSHIVPFKEFMVKPKTINVESER